MGCLIKRWLLSMVVICAVHSSSAETSFVPEKHPMWSRIDHTTCGLSKSTGRIIGGKDAALGQYPWLVQVGTIGRTMFGKIELFYCGGAIITPTFVLSAAHCVPEKQRRSLNAVRAGEHNLKTPIDCIGNVKKFCAPPPQVRRVQRLIMHPNYNNPTTQNDIILLQIQKPFIFDDFVRAICLLPSALINRDFVGEEADVAGWGIFNLDFKAASTILQRVALNVMSNAQCAPKFEKFLKLNDTQMCVGGEIGKDSCSGDSGGPLMKAIPFKPDSPPQTFLLGIVSLGFTQCGATPNPGIYTRLSGFEDWVLDNMLLITQSDEVSMRA